MSCYSSLKRNIMKLKLTLLIPLLVSPLSLAGNTNFINFAVQQAHKSSFTGCDAAIKEAHKTAGGTDMRVNTSLISSNQLSMLSTWGSKGDSVLMKSTFTKEENRCRYDYTSIVNSEKSCFAYAQELGSFNYKAEVGDYTWMENQGGVLMMLHPAGSGCTALFSYDQIK